MTLEIKDLVYLLTYIISMMTVFFSMRNRITTLERELKRGQQIIFGEQGLLNLIDQKTCKGHRDQIFHAIRKGETVSEQTLKKIEDLNRNVLRIMIHLKIEETRIDD